MANASNESVENHSVMSWSGLKWVNALKGKLGDRSRKGEGYFEKQWIKNPW